MFRRTFFTHLFPEIQCVGRCTAAWIPETFFNVINGFGCPAAAGNIEDAGIDQVLTDARLLSFFKKAGRFFSSGKQFDAFIGF